MEVGGVVVVEVDNGDVHVRWVKRRRLCYGAVIGCDGGVPCADMEAIFVTVSTADRTQGQMRRSTAPFSPRCRRRPLALSFRRRFHCPCPSVTRCGCKRLSSSNRVHCQRPYVVCLYRCFCNRIGCGYYRRD